MSETSYDRMSPEFALAQALGTVPVIADPAGGEPKVAALQPKKDWRAPFLFYIPSIDEEEEALDGDTGLQSWTGTVHCVGGTYKGMQLLCQRVKKAVREMRGAVYRTPEEETEPCQKGVVLIEDANIFQSSPDLIETEVGLYRRIYTVRLDYQTEEVYENDD